MQFTLAAISALLGLTSAAAISARAPSVGKLVARAGVCGGISTPVCCQLDALGVANLNCDNGMYILTFRKISNMRSLCRNFRWRTHTSRSRPEAILRHFEEVQQQNIAMSIRVGFLWRQTQTSLNCFRLSVEFELQP
jgi:hypothetical protein